VASIKHGKKKVTATSARDTLIREADRGMYDAKESGKNKVAVRK
jgi:PleD family two-component response regulator